MASNEQKPNLDTAERINQLNQIDQVGYLTGLLI